VTVELLRANTLTHLRYFRRSRLLLAFGLVFLLLASLGSLPVLFTESRVASFDSLKHVFLTFNQFLIVFGAALGLMVMSSHLSNRSLKMVFTKPCSPPVWLASAFLASAVVVALFTALILVCAVALSFLWHVPVRAGLLFVSLDTLIAGIGMAAYFIFLTTLMHPAIAVAFALIFNASLFYSLWIAMHNFLKSARTSVALKALEQFFHFLYLMVPMTRAFESKTGSIYSSLRVHGHDWVYLLYSLGYTLALSGLFYLLSLFLLQRKRFT